LLACRRKHDRDRSCGVIPFPPRADVNLLGERGPWRGGAGGRHRLPHGAALGRPLANRRRGSRPTRSGRSPRRGRRRAAHGERGRGLGGQALRRALPPQGEVRRLRPAEHPSQGPRPQTAKASEEAQTARKVGLRTSAPYCRSEPVGHHRRDGRDASGGAWADAACLGAARREGAPAHPVGLRAALSRAGGGSGARRAPVGLGTSDAAGRARAGHRRLGVGRHRPGSRHRPPGHGRPGAPSKAASTPPSMPNRPPSTTNGALAAHPERVRQLRSYPWSRAAVDDLPAGDEPRQL